MKNSGLMTLGTLGAIILSIIAPLIAWLNKDQLTPEERSIIANLFNFELSLFVIFIPLSIIVGFIPFLAFVSLLLAPVAWIANIAYAIIAYQAANNNKPFNAFKIYEFVK